LSNDFNKTQDGSQAIGLCTHDRAKGPFKAVSLRRRGGTWELLWKKDSDRDRIGWDEFLGQVSSGTSGEVVIGFDSRAVSFHRINIPPVGPEQLDSVITMQAEALLPLPLKEMRLGWRLNDMAEGVRTCTLAAARRQGLAEFVASARNCNVSRIFLDGQAIVKVWKELFAGTDQKSVLIRIGLSKTVVVLSENGQLSHGAVLDVGQKDLSKPAGKTRDLFVHDVQNVLEMFGVSADKKVNIFILSPDIVTYQDVISHLKASGLTAKPAIPIENLLPASPAVNAGDIYDNLEAIGAAMLALDSSDGVIDLFEDLHVQSTADAESMSRKSLKRASLVALVMLVLFLVVSYMVDKATLAKLDDERISALVEQQKLREVIARQRPDMINLLTMIDQSLPEGVIIDSFEFEKTRAATLSSRAPSYEKVYEFQKTLEKQKNISDVEIQKAVSDDKKRQVTFKMAFHYGRFTRK
jgi:hypothetical protein